MTWNDCYDGIFLESETKKREVWLAPDLLFIDAGGIPWEKVTNTVIDSV
jgi:hypothetical protein